MEHRCLCASPYALAYLVMDNQLLLECLVGMDEACWHPSCSSKGHHKWANDLVEAFVDIYASSSDHCPCGSLDFEIKLGEVPPFLGPCSWDASKHGWVSPCAYPLFEVLHSEGGPEAVQSRSDL